MAKFRTQLPISLLPEYLPRYAGSQRVLSCNPSEISAHAGSTEHVPRHSGRRIIDPLGSGLYRRPVEIPHPSHCVTLQVFPSGSDTRNTPKPPPHARGSINPSFLHISLDFCAVATCPVSRLSYFPASARESPADSLSFSLCLHRHANSTNMPPSC